MEAAKVKKLLPLSRQSWLVRGDRRSLGTNQAPANPYSQSGDRKSMAGPALAAVRGTRGGTGALARATSPACGLAVRRAGPQGRVKPIFFEKGLKNENKSLMYLTDNRYNVNVRYRL